MVPLNLPPMSPHFLNAGSVTLDSEGTHRPGDTRKIGTEIAFPLKLL